MSYLSNNTFDLPVFYPQEVRSLWWTYCLVIDYLSAVLGMFIRVDSSQNKNFDIDSESEIGLPSDSEVIRRWSGSHWEIALEQAALSIKTGEKVEKIPIQVEQNMMILNSSH